MKIRTIPTPKVVRSSSDLHSFLSTEIRTFYAPTNTKSNHAFWKRVQNARFGIFFLHFFHLFILQRFLAPVRLASPTDPTLTIGSRVPPLISLPPSLLPESKNAGKRQTRIIAALIVLDAHSRVRTEVLQHITNNKKSTKTQTTQPQTREKKHGGTNHFLEMEKRRYIRWTKPTGTPPEY
jgi:hypothetical protein